jgi:hypothetical protein
MWAPLLGTGVFLTIRPRFVQVVRFREALWAMVPARSAGEGPLSPLQAFMTALGSSLPEGGPERRGRVRAAPITRRSGRHQLTPELSESWALQIP